MNDWIWVLRTDSVGKVTWSRGYSGCGSFYPHSSCIRETSDGGYIVVGGNGDPAGWRGMYLLRLNSDGDKIWIKSYENVHGQSVLEASDGGFEVCCLGDAYKFDSEGDTVWHHCYGYGILNDIRLTNDGGYVMTGTEGYEGLWIVKADSEGYAHDREVSATVILSLEVSYEDFSSASTVRGSEILGSRT